MNTEIRPVGMEIDPHAKVYKLDSLFLRAIESEYQDFYNEIARSQVVRELIEEKILVETRISSHVIEGYKLVLEHPSTSFISYPFEWSPSMFKDAALAILKFNIELMKHGLCTQDGDPWNIVFEGTSPLFIDFTSIIKMPEESNGRWLPLKSFEQYCINTLLLMSYGYPTVARCLLREVLNYPPEQLVSQLLKNSFYQVGHKDSIVLKSLYRVRKIKQDIYYVVEKDFRELLKDVLSKFRIGSPKDGIEELEMTYQNLESLKVEPCKPRFLGSYINDDENLHCGDVYRSMQRTREANKKAQIIEGILSKIRPAKVLDMGCNYGLYGQIASEIGSKVVGIDLEEYALDFLYRHSKELDLNIMPLYINAVAPAEAIGFKEIPPLKVEERLKSDCVLCLALVHHLVFGITNMSFPHIAKVLDSYSRKFLILEFVSREDDSIQLYYSHRSSSYHWYSLDNIKRELGAFFFSIEMVANISESRCILLCEKK